MSWICSECGERYGKHRGMISIWHYDYCDYCGNYKAVTESRDYNYPEKLEDETA